MSIFVSGLRRGEGAETWISGSGLICSPPRWCSGRRRVRGHTKRDCSASRSSSSSASPRLAERGANPLRVVADINARLGHTACIYATKPDVRARTVRFEKNIAANHTTYAIYQVQVTAHGIAEDRDRRHHVDVLAAADDVHAARRAPAQTVSH